MLSRQRSSCHAHRHWQQQGLSTLWKDHVCEVAFMQLAFSICILDHYMIHFVCIKRTTKSGKTSTRGISTNYCNKLASFLNFSPLTLSLLSSHSLISSKSLYIRDNCNQLMLKLLTAMSSIIALNFVFPNTASENHIIF